MFDSLQLATAFYFGQAYGEACLAWPLTVAKLSLIWPLLNLHIHSTKLVPISSLSCCRRWGMLRS